MPGKFSGASPTTASYCPSNSTCKRIDDCWVVQGLLPFPVRCRLTSACSCRGRLTCGCAANALAADAPVVRPPEPGLPPTNPPGPARNTGRSPPVRTDANESAHRHLMDRPPDWPSCRTVGILSAMESLLARLQSVLADRCRIERKVGAGGMALVLLAHDLKHDREVAIKVLHPDLGFALGGERFLSETKTTAKFQHPHISGHVALRPRSPLH
jgi:hypothetical protein